MTSEVPLRGHIECGDTENQVRQRRAELTWHSTIFFRVFFFNLKSKVRMYEMGQVLGHPRQINRNSNIQRALYSNRELSI